MSVQSIAGPACAKCRRRMTWVSEQVVNHKPMQVFHCESCDKYVAALPGTSGVKNAVAPGLVSGL